MALQELLSEYQSRFRNNGSLRFRAGDRIVEFAKVQGVPNKGGVYLIYVVVAGRRYLQYVGSSGRVITTGRTTTQGLRGRLANRQDRNTSRQRWYEQILVGWPTQGVVPEALLFWWFVTWDERTRVFPAKAELDLLQAYYDDYGRLPNLNMQA